MIIGGLDGIGNPQQQRRTAVLPVKRREFHTGESLYAGFMLASLFRPPGEREEALNFGVSNGGDEVLPVIQGFTITSIGA